MNVSNGSVSSRGSEQVEEKDPNSYLESISVDPREYGCKKYTELDISAHSVIIEGLPRNMARRQIEK